MWSVLNSTHQLQYGEVIEEARRQVQELSVSYKTFRSHEADTSHEYGIAGRYGGLEDNDDMRRGDANE